MKETLHNNCVASSRLKVPSLELMNDASNVLCSLVNICSKPKCRVKLHDSRDLDPLDISPFPNKQLSTSIGNFFLYTLEA